MATISYYDIYAICNYAICYMYTYNKLYVITLFVITHLWEINAV